MFAVLDCLIPTYMSISFHHLAFRRETCQGGKPRKYK